MSFSNILSFFSHPSSNSPAQKIAVSTSTIQNTFKYDVFISFRGEDTRKGFVDHLYHALKDKCIYTYKDDVKIKKGERISDDLMKSIEDSKFYIIVFSKNYASSSWCLEELAKIMECHKMAGHTAYPVFYDVEPTEVRNQSGAVKKAFFKNKNKAAAQKWKGALKEAADLAGWELKNTNDGHEAEFIQKIVQEISLELRSINTSFDEKLVGMESRVKDVVSSLEIGIDEVRMIGIKGMGGVGKTTTARAVFDYLSNHFEAKSFVGNVREVSNATMFGLKNLQEQVLSDVLNEHVPLNTVDDGKHMMKRRMFGKKVLLVLDDVDHIDQLEALAGGVNWFKQGSRVIITTRDEQVLEAHRVHLIRDINLLSHKEAICLFSRYAFGTDNPVQGYKELSVKVVWYAAGLPLSIKVLGSFLCGKDMDVWENAIKRLKNIPFKEILEKLELSYIDLEYDHKEIFLDIACILKGKHKEDAIRILESCGFHARIGLKVLEQRSLITIYKDKDKECLGMHDHIEEMGKNVVRREHRDEPNKHSHLWKYKEIEDILANDMGTEATRCLRLDMSKVNSRILMCGLGKMKKLRYLEVDYADYYQKTSDAECLDDTTQHFPNSLKYLKCMNYPFLYLPKTFQAKNLVGLEMEYTRMVQLWEEGEKKDLQKLKFLSLSFSDLTTFDFRITPNLEALSLGCSYRLEELCMPVSCQKLNYLHISQSKIRTFDLGLTPNLETLSLVDCAKFVELHMSTACPNLKFLDLRFLGLRSLDLELVPNLDRLDLENCNNLVEINAPVGCLKKVGRLNLRGCLRFTHFLVSCGRSEPKDNCSSATLDLVGESINLCQLHPNSNLPKLQFRCYYYEDLPSSVGNIEKLISFGLCACTDFKKFSDMICSLQCLRKLILKCNIPEFPKDLGKLECLEELWLYSTKIKHLPDSICMLKRLKSLQVSNGYFLQKLPEDLLEKLPEDLGKLECLEKLIVRSKKIEYLPDSICMLKRLKYLDVRYCCSIGKLPEDIGRLECVEELYLSSTSIKHLPDSICMLKRLKELYVTDCCHLEKLPEDIGQLESLEKLDLSATTIKDLPDSICMLKHLNYLNLSLCAHLEKLPEDLGQLECLEQRGISRLPQSLPGLKHLIIAASEEVFQLNHLPSEITTTSGSRHGNLVGMESRVKDVVSSLEVGIDDVCMIGIKGMIGAGKTTTARAVFDHLSNHFEAKSFVENVRKVSCHSLSGLKKLQEQVLSDVLNEHVTLDSVKNGKDMMKRRMCGKKVLLVLDDVNNIDELEALAGEPKWFKPGSRILITTRDEQVLLMHRVNVIRDIDLLSKQEAIALFSSYAFGRKNPLQGFEELSGKVVSYAAGFPSLLKVLGSSLCGKDRVEWVDAIDRLEHIPLNETMEKPESSYWAVQTEYKEIFLDIACILKGKRKEEAIKILESCGFRARSGLRVLEERSLITVDEHGFLCMHPHIEEMGKNIVRHEHPNKPHKRTRLWINEEIEDILANDMGTEATRYLRLDMSEGNTRILLRGFGKMKRLEYLEVNYAKVNGECLGSYPKFDYPLIDEASKYFPNSLKYLKCTNYPFLYLPKTFQADNLVGLEMESSRRMVQLWEDGEEKALHNLKFLSLSKLELTTFDLRLTPNLETLSLENCALFVELHVSAPCPNLKTLKLRKSKLRSLDLELIPSLETLDLEDCNELVDFNAPVGCLEKVVSINLHGCTLLEKLPEDIGRFGCLKELDITGTGISYLPQSIFELEGLLITASSELLQLYDFPSEIRTRTSSL